MNTDSTVIRSDSERAAPPLPKGERIPVLVFLEGKEKNRQHPLEKRETVVGRDSRTDCFVDDAKASRHHSKIIYSNQGHKGEIPDCRIIDLGSTNGTFVNGEEIVDEDGTWLQDRDRIQIGNSILGYFLMDEEAVSLT